MSEPSLRGLRGPLVALLVGLCLAGSLPGQSRDRSGDEFAVHLYSLRHQRAVDAFQVVLPLLSSQGSVELRPGGNTLVVRDYPRQVDRVLVALREFDHETRVVSVSLWLVRAERGAPISPPAMVDPKLSEYPEVLNRLQDYLQYSSYSIVGSSEARGREGEDMTFDLTPEYEVRFRLGTVIGVERVPLEEFEVTRRSTEGGTQRLLRSHLNSWTDRPFVIALSAGEARALLIVIRAELVNVGSGGP